MARKITKPIAFVGARLDKHQKKFISCHVTKEIVNNIA
jgi:folate-dependent tRNA-U54 methylase TrmFO/GidA